MNVVMFTVMDKHKNKACLLLYLFLSFLLLLFFLGAKISCTWDLLIGRTDTNQGY